MKFAIVTPTIGRESLKRLLFTLKGQIWRDFCHIVVGDGPQAPWVERACQEHGAIYLETKVKEGFYGSAPRNYALTLLEQRTPSRLNLEHPIDYVIFVADDDLLLEPALYNANKQATDHERPALLWQKILFTNKFATEYRLMPRDENPGVEGDWDFLNCFYRLDILRGLRVEAAYNHDHRLWREVLKRAQTLGAASLHEAAVRVSGVGGVHMLSWDTFEQTKP